jgi:hexosaminidase
MRSNRFAGVFCAGNEETFAFLEAVLAEVCDLFPGKYVHIGGDEVPTENWRGCPKCQAAMQLEGFNQPRQLESCFVHRLGDFLNARGRSLIGWSEIREHGLPPQAVVMDWIGGAVEAARAGHEVVRTPETQCYFDFYQSRNRAAEPRATAAYLPLSRVYDFEPTPAGLDPQYQKYILGAQGNIWTEYIPSISQVEYMAFPRACALAEVLWSPAASRNWAGFQRRLAMHSRRLDEMGIAHHAMRAVE